MTYIINILENKYNVIISNEDPDLVFWTNIYSSTNSLDSFTNTMGSTHTQYPNSKKIFLSCEACSNHLDIVEQNNKHFAIGPEPLIHDRYLSLPIHNTTSAWGLYDESKLFDHPYNWLTEIKDGKKILKEKKHFCGVVQNSIVPERVELYNKLSEYKFVRASGGWITNVPPDEATIIHPKIDGEGYLSKIKFLKECKFSIQVQSNIVRHLTVEKLIQAFAAETIPIYYGNDLVLNDGFNPKSFINCHDFSSFNDVVEYVKEIDKNDKLFEEIVSEPIFIGNKLPYYYNSNYVLDFLDKIINYD